MDLDSVTDELYSLPSEDFTATRNAREKEAKTAGDKDLAGAIRLLRKPSTGAWLANQLVRQHPDEIRPLLELGAGLRSATATLSGEQLRELSKQQHQLIHTLVQQAKRLANAVGHKVSDGSARALEDTLHAALADEAAADQLKTGRLAEPLQRTGFTSGDHTEPVTRPPHLSPPSLTTERFESSGRLRAARLERAERDEELARTAMQDAVAAQERAHAAIEQAEDTVRRAAANVGRLRNELGQATAVQSQAESEERRLRSELAKTERAARLAAGQLQDATQNRQRWSTQ